jgi:hypothetical protein
LGANVVVWFGECMDTRGKLEGKMWEGGEQGGGGEGGTRERGGRIMGDSCGPDEMVSSARPPHRSAYMYQVQNVCLGGG